jgi:hypothetical protein
MYTFPALIAACPTSALSNFISQMLVVSMVGLNDRFAQSEDLSAQAIYDKV